MASSTSTANHFDEVLPTIQQAPQNQRSQTAFQSIAQQMQASGNPQVQQWGQDLALLTPQIVKACQQQGG